MILLSLARPVRFHSINATIAVIIYEMEAINRKKKHTQKISPYPEQFYIAFFSGEYMYMLTSSDSCFMIFSVLSSIIFSMAPAPCLNFLAPYFFVWW